MNLKNYFKEARKGGWAIGQFNFSDLKVLEAIVLAAKKMRSPVILGTSEGESKSIGLKQAVSLVKAFREESGLPIFLNLDHGKSLEYIREAIDAGYDAVHFDGSSLPLDENIRIAKEVVLYGRKKKVFIEGEVGVIRGSSEIHKEKVAVAEEDLTDPAEALKFIRETKIDNLAVNIGLFHGIALSGKKPDINFQRLKEIKNKTEDRAGLVLHGGSGVPEEDVKRAIKLGIVKININTELRLAFTGALKEVLRDFPEENTSYKYMPRVVRAVQEVVESKIQLFGSKNR